MFLDFNEEQDLAFVETLNRAVEIQDYLNKQVQFCMEALLIPQDIVSNKERISKYLSCLLITKSLSDSLMSAMEEGLLPFHPRVTDISNISESDVMFSCDIIYSQASDVFCS